MHSILTIMTYAAVSAIIASGSATVVDAFSVAPTAYSVHTVHSVSSIQSVSKTALGQYVSPVRRFEQKARHHTVTPRFMADGDAEDPNDIIGKRIIVSGDVNGGYLRTCISNEAGKFRRLLGTMSPPDDGDEAEIYVEGKRKMIDGFIRWCKKGDKNIGLNQRLTVVKVTDEDATGLYDGFYVRTGRED